MIRGVLSLLLLSHKEILVTPPASGDLMFNRKWTLFMPFYTLFLATDNESIWMRGGNLKHCQYDKEWNESKANKKGVILTDWSYFMNLTHYLKYFFYTFVQRLGVHMATGSRISGQWTPGQKSQPVQTCPFGWWTRLSGFHPPGVKYFSWVASTEDYLTAWRDNPLTLDTATTAMRVLNIFILIKYRKYQESRGKNWISYSRAGVYIDFIMLRATHFN